MSNRAVVTYPLGLLVLVGLARGVQLSTTQKGSATAAAVNEVRTGSGGGGADRPRVYPTGMSLVQEFLQVSQPPQPPDSAADVPPARTDPVPERSGVVCFPTLGTMVATLPDPADSHLDWAFDSDYE